MESDDMRKRMATGVIMFTMLSLMQLSAETLSLDKEKCIALALKNNTGLLEESISLQTSERSAKNSWNLLLPDVSASLSLSSSSSYSDDTDETKLGVSPGLSLTYTVSPGLKESMRQLQIELEGSQISYDDALLQLKMDVESEFYYLLTSRGNLEIQKNDIELAQRRYEQVQEKFRNGLVPELDVLQERVNVANLKPTYSSLKATYQNRLKEFLVILGLDPSQEVSLEGSLEVDTYELDALQLIEQYLANRSDIKAQQNSLELLESSLRYSRKTGHLPSISLSATVSEDYSKPFSSGTWQDSSQKTGLAFSIGVSLGLDNYIPGSSTDLEIKELEDSIQKAQLSFDQLIQDARLEIINVVNSINTDRENIELSRLNLELSEKSYAMTEESFSRGKSDRITLDDAQQDLLTARQNLLESQYDYMSDLITLRGALGIESLDELNKADKE
jgi:multidrug efflux system outer membrane protein